MCVCVCEWYVEMSSLCPLRGPGSSNTQISVSTPSPRPCLLTHFLFKGTRAPWRNHQLQHWDRKNRRKAWKNLGQRKHRRCPRMMATCQNNTEGHLRGLPLSKFGTLRGSGQTRTKIIIHRIKEETMSPHWYYTDRKFDEEWGIDMISQYLCTKSQNTY